MKTKENYDNLQVNLSTLLKEEKNESYFFTINKEIKDSQSFTQMLNILIIFINIENEFSNYTKEENKENFSNLFKVLQEQFIVLGNDLDLENRPAKEMFYLYKISSKCQITSNDVFNLNIKELKENFDSHSSDERVQNFLNEILFILEIINGEEKSLHNYITRTLTLNVLTLEQKYTEFFQNFLIFLDLDISILINVFNELYEEKYYFSLPPIKRRSTYNWILHVILIIKKLQNHIDLSKLYDKWLNLLHLHIKKDQIDEVMYLNFFIFHIMGNLFKTNKDSKNFNKKINIPTSKYYKKWAEENFLVDCKKHISKEGKIKIAFIETRIVKNSPYFVLINLLKTLMSNVSFTDKYEVVIYSANYFEKSEDAPICINEINDLGIKVINPNEYVKKRDSFYHSHLEKVLNLRNSLIENNTDIMITYNDYDIFNFLFTTRTTPVQIYWSHINSSYNIEGIDKRISHFAQEGNDFDFRIFTIPVDIEKYNPEVDQKEIKKIKDKFPKDSLILGSIGRLIKVDNDEYLKTITTIMKKHPQSIYLACGSGNQENIKRKIKELGIEDRFYFEGHVEPHTYGHVIDLYLDTFPSNGGESFQEYVYKLKRYVSKHKDFNIVNNLFKKDDYFRDEILYSKEDIETINKLGYINSNNPNIPCFRAIPIVKTNEDYVNVVDLLINDKETTEKIISELKKYLKTLEKEAKENLFCDFKKAIFN